MENAGQFFVALLQGQKMQTELSPTQLAHLYTKAAFLSTAMKFIKEQLWLSNQKQSTQYQEFLTPLFENQLQSLCYLKEFLLEEGAKKIDRIAKKSTKIENEILEIIQQQNLKDQKTFLVQALENMIPHFVLEEKEKDDGSERIRLYRTFDRIDEIFDLNYQLDVDMERDTFHKERLYQGAGVGVQSGYSTILLALEHLKLQAGNTVVDLGSGYGRVGLVTNLLHPEVTSIGFEYVPHRVDVSNIASEALGLEDNLSFFAQDLSVESFKIPKADVYYLYDPFTKETYDYVLEQIVQVSKDQPVTIVTKGNARGWLLDIASEHGWPKPTYLDEKNLCIFKTEDALS